MQDTAELVIGEQAAADGANGGTLRVPKPRPLGSTPPPTNRGCFVPSKATGEPEIEVGLDYLRVTVFGAFEDVAGVVERELVEPAGLQHVPWQSVGPVDRWELLEILGDDLVQLKAPKTAQEPYVVVELKGDGCSVCQAHLHGFMSAVDQRWRWNGKRADVRWDHHGLSPSLLDEAGQAGNFVSRLLNVGDVWWQRNIQGGTAYVGDRKKARHVRCYDKRGFNRLELELHDQWAAELLGKFVADGPGELPRHGLGCLLATVDYRDMSGGRPDRAPRLAWWSEFVGQAQKVKTLTKTGEKKGTKPLPIGAADDWVKRNRRQILRAERALGSSWLFERARYWSRQAGEMALGSDELLGEQDQAAVERLKVYRGSGLCGTAEDLPF